MAKQPQQPAPQQPAKIPANWGKLTAAQKTQWRVENQGYVPPTKTLGAPKQYGTTAAPTPAQQPGTFPTPAQQPQSPTPGAYEEASAAGDQEQAGDQAGAEQLAEQVSEDVARQMSAMDARCLVATILRAIAEKLDAGVGNEE